MEGIKERVADFLQNCCRGYVYGEVYGGGYGGGNGSGYGYFYGGGNGSGGCRDYVGRNGDGSGNEDGSGSGRGDGSGSGDGSGYGDGYRYRSGYVRDNTDVKRFCGCDVYMIDGISTIIDNVRGNIAKGRILKSDLTTRQCYVVKGEGYYAHGETLRDAIEAMRDKLFKDMPEDERIEAFVREHELQKVYNCSDLYEWHHSLTGSCKMGRKEFAKANGIDIERDTMTVQQFIALTRDAYGGRVIRKLEQVYLDAEASSNDP